jgi:hypothetical protein
MVCRLQKSSGAVSALPTANQPIVSTASHVVLWFIPIIGWILLVIWCAERGKPNRYGIPEPQAQNSA